MKTTRPRPGEPSWVEHATPFERFMHRTPLWRIFLYGYGIGFVLALGVTLLCQWLTR